LKSEACSLRGKIPNNKHQAPNSKFRSFKKFAVYSQQLAIGVWKLEIGTSETPNDKHQIPKCNLQNRGMEKNHREYDLEERTYLFARECRILVDKIPMTIQNVEDARQLIKSSGSVSANYIEANESLSKKDFRYRIKICRKESKESKLWLRLLKDMNKNELHRFKPLLQEADELRKIFSAILKNSDSDK
jgi:four helix bundle protein